jgi:hypothetical protein
MAMKAGLVLLLLAGPGVALSRPPIIDMHLHARRLGPIEGAPALCAPPPANPRWDNSRPIGEGLSVPNCAHPLRPAASGDQVMRETLAILARRNIIAMTSGEPEDVARWRAAAPERIIRGLDLRITPRPAPARFQPRSPRRSGHSTRPARSRFWAR